MSDGLVGGDVDCCCCCCLEGLRLLITLCAGGGEGGKEGEGRVRKQGGDARIEGEEHRITTRYIPEAYTTLLTVS